MFPRALPEATLNVASIRAIRRIGRPAIEPAIAAGLAAHLGVPVNSVTITGFVASPRWGIFDATFQLIFIFS